MTNQLAELQEQVVAPAASFERQIAETEALESATRPLEIGNSVYETNLPAGANPFEDGDVELRRKLISPQTLDALPEGEFTVSKTEEAENFDGELETRKTERQIKVWMGPKGKVVDKNAFTEHWANNGNGVDKLMQQLGYTYDAGEITAIPTPETLKSAAYLLGVDIRLLPDTGFIEGSKYLKAFAEGAYPVATGTESDYRHDSEDDHLGAMVLGGETLKVALQKVAAGALTKGPAEISKATKDIDVFTASLRAVIAPHHEIAGEAYGNEQGRKTLLELGGEMGLTAEETGQILEAAQKTAITFGIKVNELK